MISVFICGRKRKRPLVKDTAPPWVIEAVNSFINVYLRPKHGYKFVNFECRFSNSIYYLTVTLSKFEVEVSFNFKIRKTGLIIQPFWNSTLESVLAPYNEKKPNFRKAALKMMPEVDKYISELSLSSVKEMMES